MCATSWHLILLVTHSECMTSAYIPIHQITSKASYTQCGCQRQRASYTKACSLSTPHSTKGTQRVSPQLEGPPVPERPSRTHR